MPRGPRGEKRPADTNAAAVMIAKIATGEIEDKVTDDGKSAAPWLWAAWAERHEPRRCPQKSAGK